jgi:hypothetical protein
MRDVLMTLVRVVGWTAALLAAVTIVAVNPWFALVVVPGLLVAGVGGRGVALARRFKISGTAVMIALPATAVVACSVLGAIAIVGYLLLRDGGDDPAGSPPPASIEITGTYAGLYWCAQRCDEWSGEHSLAITMDVHIMATSLPEALTRRLVELGWTLTRTTVVDEDRIRVLFEQTGPARITTIRDWPLRTTQSLTLPSPVPAGWIASMPPGREAALLAGPLSDVASEEGLEVYLRLEPESALTLRYPKLAVSATAPESSPADIPGGRQERHLTVRPFTGASASLDVLAPLVRNEAAARLVTNADRGWAWLGLAIVVIGGITLKEASGAFVGYVKRRLSRLWQPAATEPAGEREVATPPAARSEQEESLVIPDSPKPRPPPPRSDEVPASATDANRESAE